MYTECEQICRPRYSCFHAVLVEGFLYDCPPSMSCICAPEQRFIKQIYIPLYLTVIKQWYSSLL